MRLFGHSPEPAAEHVAEAPKHRFVCRTCGQPGPFYVAQQVTNWNSIGDPWRKPDGSLTYRRYNGFLPGTPGPPLAYYCSTCQTSCDTLEELVLEAALMAAPNASEGHLQ